MLLADLVVDSAGPNYTRTRLYAAEAAFQLHAWRLHLPLLLRSRAVGLGLTTTPITTALVERIRTRVANPIRAAALVTALANDATGSELTGPRADQLAPDAAYILAHSNRQYVFEN